MPSLAFVQVVMGVAVGIINAILAVFSLRVSRFK